MTDQTFQRGSTYIESRKKKTDLENFGLKTFTSTWKNTYTSIIFSSTITNIVIKLTVPISQFKILNINGDDRCQTIWNPKPNTNVKSWYMKYSQNRVLHKGYIFLNLQWFLKFYIRMDLTYAILHVILQTNFYKKKCFVGETKVN